MPGKAPQRKGRGGERELAEKLRELGFQDAKVSPAMAFGRAPDLQGVPHVHVECKRCESYHLGEWLAQAETDATHFGDGLPAVFFRRSREGWKVCMTLESWAALYHRTGAKD